MHERPGKRQLWPELERLAQPARERRQLDPAALERIILELCDRTALTASELADLLYKTEPFISVAIRPLIQSGKLNPSDPAHRPHDSEQRYSSNVPLESAGTTAVKTPIRQVRVPYRPPAPSVPFASAVESDSTLLNDRSSPLIAMFLGAVIALLAPRSWWLFAGVAAALLAVLHVATNSSQYLQYRKLDSTRRRVITFLSLKFLVAFLEIAAVYGLVTLILRRIA